jgi:hypothetical protein
MSEGIEEVRRILDTPENVALPGNVRSIKDARQRRRLRSEELRSAIRYAGDIQPSTEVHYLVKGWLAPASLAVLYGPANVGKTFLALDIAHHVAQGRPWAGCRVNPAPVLHVTLEGGAGFERRVAALDRPSFWILPAALSLMDPRRDATWLAEAVADLAKQTGNFGLIIVDTLGGASRFLRRHDHRGKQAARLQPGAVRAQRQGACPFLRWRLVARMKPDRDKPGQAGTTTLCPGRRAGQAGGGTNGTPPLKGGVYRVVPAPVPDLPAKLDELSQRVGRLAPSRHDPERYHAEKSEIAFELRTLARRAARS